MALIEGSDSHPLSDEQRAEVTRLRRAARIVGIALVVVLLLAAACLILLVDEPLTDDMRKLAFTAAVAGLTGGSLASLIELVNTVSDGFVLVDGTKVLRGHAAARHLEHLRDWQQRKAARARDERAMRAARGQTDDEREPADDEPEPEPRAFGGLAAAAVPMFIAYPLIGAVFGVVAFAGVVGGFLVASSQEGTYSTAALTFIAFLGGFFAGKFFQRLSAAADALFGTSDSGRGGSKSQGALDRQ